MPASATIDLEELRNAADAACRLLKTLSNPDRLLLLCRLSQGEACVGELESELGIAQPTLSQQLGVLRGEGLVEARREGKNVYYSLADARVERMLPLLYELFCKR